MKYSTDRSYANPEAAARHLLAIANWVEPVQGRIHIEMINGPFLFRDGDAGRIRCRAQTGDRERVAGAT